VKIELYFAGIVSHLSKKMAQFAAKKTKNIVYEN
jgi:hypothetical protein